MKGPAWGQLAAAWAPVLYAGILSCGVAYTLQVVAQKHVEPTLASLVLSLESVFSVLAGWLVLGQALSARELGVRADVLRHCSGAAARQKRPDGSGAGRIKRPGRAPFAGWRAHGGRGIL